MTQSLNDDAALGEFSVKDGTRRRKLSRAEAPLGAIRERDAGNGQLVRMVKIRMGGPTGLRWLPYAKWWWGENRGPVPAGRRICHADGNLLNDDPSNLVALTPGEVFKLYHRLDPEMSRQNRAACGRLASRRNIETATLRRLTSWLPCQWYPVDFQASVIHNRPRRKRWMVYADFGFAERLAAGLRHEAHEARCGDTAAAAFVLRQAATFSAYWRWVRSASLGWPGLNCMTACILASLADASPQTTSRLIASVTALRCMFGWNPAALQRGVLSSCASAIGDWISCDRAGRGEGVWRIGTAAVAARLEGPRIVPVRGVDLNHSRFGGFSRLNPFGPADERSEEAVPA